jgi:hypothetical protein
VLVAALAASVLLSANEVRRHVAQAVGHDSRLTPANACTPPAIALASTRHPSTRFGVELRPRERYAVDVPPGAKGPFITRGAVVRAYAAFYFLPAIQVDRADRVRFRFR